MNIIYLIPDLELRGGIQHFAKEIKHQLQSHVNILLTNFVYPPRVFAPIDWLFAIGPFFDRYLQVRAVYYSFFKRTLIHSWHIRIAQYLKKNSYIVTCHGMELLPKNMQNGTQSRYQEILDNAYRVTVDSNYTKDLLLENFKVENEKISLIFPCVDTKKILDIKKVPHKKLIIGTLSRFVERKNILSIIRALSIVHEKYNLDFEFHLAGEGAQKDEIMAELNKVKFVWKYHGKISDEEKFNSFYPNLDIFVLPVLDLPNSVEGFGIVYIEANCYGIPVVASAVNGVTDAVKPGVSGVFANPTDIEDIAGNIVKLSKTKDDYFASSKKWVEQFDVSIISEQFNHIYKQWFLEMPHLKN